MAAGGGGRGPQTVTEEILCGLFAEVLGVDRMSGLRMTSSPWAGTRCWRCGWSSRMRRCWAPRWRSRALFETPTPAGLAAWLGQAGPMVPPNLIPAGAQEITPGMLPLVELDAEQIAAVVAGVDGGAANVADIYPLAPLQEGMLFHHLLAGEDTADVYLTSSLLAFDSRDRLEEFTAALERVIARHDIFRTSLAWQGLPEPVQVVWRHAQLPVTEVPLADGPDPAAVLAAVAGPRMDLGRAPLLRVHVAAGAGLPASGWHCCSSITWCWITPAWRWCWGRSRRCWPGGRTGCRCRCRSVISWRRRGWVSPGRSTRRYFAGLLGDVTEPTAPFGLLNARGDGSAAARADLRVQDELAVRVRERARVAGVSAATVFHLAWARVLAVLAGRDDVVFGTVLFGRMNAGAGCGPGAGVVHEHAAGPGGGR